MTNRFSDAFLSEAERHAAWGAEQLHVLGSFLPGGPWTAELSSCTYQQGGLELRVAVLGTYDRDERSWMWGWANPGWRGEEVVALTEAVERYGRAHGIPELAAEVVDLAGFDDPDRAAEMLAFTGMGVVGAPGYLGQMAGPGTRVYFLPDDPRVPRAALEPVALPRVLLTGAGLIGHSAPQVVRGFFEHHGVPYRTEDGGGRIVAELPDGNAVEVGFDGLGRISGVGVDRISR
ncbi:MULTISPECIES: DUF6882 domain-containing protein [Streptomyces]|uniref:Uncharacterized protein n=1 Tax=Streptomyces katrae TaxID=68223 RepID=A0A0F4J7W9_9ACTN|nr:DUF6882 domain-containing protein [Streptomyces katrae]KJY29863.1 hypothetical protein VR44_21880 [Streptomyces katrae]